MSTSPYTWAQWRYRFEEALIAAAWQEPYDVDVFRVEWEKGEDPWVAANEYMIGHE